MRPLIWHEPAYLIETGAIPRYDLRRSIPTSSVDALAATTRNSDILGNSLITPQMPDTGGRIDLGPLPGWTVMALLSSDSRARSLMLEAADASGSFSIHYRDPKTQRLISIDETPGFTLDADVAASMPGVGVTLPATSLPTTSPYVPDSAHQPSLAYMPYLLTGDPYYLDELYFWANWNFIRQNFEYRGRAQGWLIQDQTRAQAWALRTLGHAAWLAPDADPEKAYFEQKLANNLTRYRQVAIDSNPFGWWGEMTQVQSPKEWLSTDTKTYTTPFESDFLITTMHWLARLGYSDAKPTRDWLSKFAVGRFTNAPAFNPNYGAAYVLSVRGNSGQIYDSWQAIFANSTARAGAVGTTLRDSECPFCYPAIARAALAAAVDARVGVAKEAYAFVDADIGRATTAKDPFQSDPTWAIVPEGTAIAASAPSGTSPPQQAQPASGTPPQAGSPTLPVPPQLPAPPSTGGAPATAPSGPTGGPSAWPREADGRIRQSTWDSLPLNEWIEVPGTKLRQVAPPFRLLGVEGFAAIIDDWCGAAYDTRRRRMQMQCGGHQGYVGNEIVTLNLESMTVERIWGPDAPTSFWTPTATQFDYSVDPTTGLSLSRNNNPTAAHTYRTPVYIPEYDITVRLAQNPGPVVFRNDINDWDRRYQVPSSRTWSPGQGIPYAYSSRAMAFRGKYYAFTEEYLVYRWDPSRNMTKPDGSLAYGVVEQFPLRHPIGPSATSVEIPDTGEFIHFSRDGGPYPEVVITRLDRPGASDFSQTATLQGVRELVTNPNWAAAGAAWIPELGRILVLENRNDGQPNRLIAVNRAGANFTAEWYASSGAPPGYSINGVYSRMQAVRFGSVILLVVVTHVDQNVRIIRVK